MAYLMSFVMLEMCSKHTLLQVLESRVIMMTRSLQSLPTWHLEIPLLCLSRPMLESAAFCSALSDCSAQALTAGPLDCQQHAGVLCVVKLPSSDEAVQPLASSDIQLTAYIHPQDRLTGNDDCWMCTGAVQPEREGRGWQRPGHCHSSRRRAKHSIPLCKPDTPGWHREGVPEDAR